MKRLLIIFLIAIIAGCADGPVEPVDPIEPDPIEPAPPVDPPVTPPETPVEPDPTVDADLTDPDTEKPSETNETTVEPVEIEDPQLDPRMTVETYLEYMTQALDGDEDAYEEAYKLISPHSTKNLHWMGSLERFKSEADDTYNKYESGNNITSYIETEEFGGAYRIHYGFGDREEVYYITQTYDGLYYIASGSKRGSMFWRITIPE